MNTTDRFMAALARFNTIAAQAAGAFGHQRALAEEVRRAHNNVLAAEQDLLRHQNAPAGRGSRLDRARAARAEARAELVLKEARLWLEAAEAARAAQEPECQRLGRLRDDAEPLIQRLRAEAVLEADNVTEA